MASLARTWLVVCCSSILSCSSPSTLPTDLSDAMPPLPSMLGTAGLGDPCSIKLLCAFPYSCVTDWTGASVCCNSSCRGACESCTAKGTGGLYKDGICGPTVAGVDCGTQACSGTTYSPPPECNGSGGCMPLRPFGCKTGYACSGTACATVCKDDTACAAGYYCSAGACVLKKKNGEACTPTLSPTQCASGYCVDGVCCNTTCVGVCQACSAKVKGKGADGVCEPVAAGSDPNAECAADAGYPGSCKSDGMCDGKGACRLFAPSTVPCGTTSCTAGSVSGLVCNGSGSCTTSTGVSCSPFACDVGKCKTTCTTDTDCDSKAFCGPGSVCVQKKLPGEGCSAGKQCDSDFCVDGVCCKSACTAQCEACDVAPNAGNCIPVAGVPHGTRTACKVDDATCGGSCDGVNIATCTYPPTTTACGSTCTTAKEKKQTCDGRGACVDGATRDCGAYQCVDGTHCGEACKADGECTPGYRCGSEGRCAPMSSKCNDSLSEAIGNDGTRKPCAPYLCDAVRGICNTMCATSADCAEGSTCDTVSKTCVMPSSPTAESGGCGFGAGGARAFGAVFLLGLAGALARRRRQH